MKRKLVPTQQAFAKHRVLPRLRRLVHLDFAAAASIGSKFLEVLRFLAPSPVVALIAALPSPVDLFAVRLVQVQLEEARLAR